MKKLSNLLNADSKQARPHAHHRGVRVASLGSFHVFETKGIFPKENCVRMDRFLLFCIGYSLYDKSSFYSKFVTLLNPIPANFYDHARSPHKKIIQFQAMLVSMQHIYATKSASLQHLNPGIQTL